MGLQNDRTFGVAALDLRRMQGRGQGVVDVTARRGLAKIARALTYQTQLPRGCVVMVGDAYHDVTFDSKGWLWIHSSDGSVPPARSPQARVHVIDLVVDPDVISPGLVAAVLADPGFCTAVCACDCPGPGPG